MPEIPKLKNQNLSRYKTVPLPKGFARVTNRDINNGITVFLREHIHEGYECYYTGVTINRYGYAVIKDSGDITSIHALNKLCRFK